MSKGQTKDMFKQMEELFSKVDKLTKEVKTQNKEIKYLNEKIAKKYSKYYVILTHLLSPKQGKSMDIDIRKIFSCLYPVKKIIFPFHF